MFTTSCFIRKNEIELIEKLCKIGYVVDSTILKYGNLPDNNPFLSIKDGVIHITVDGVRILGVNCGINEQLFLAIAAIRDDSDKGQWFTDGSNWALCMDKTFGEYWSKNMCTISLDTIHKADIEELIKYFK